MKKWIACIALATTPALADTYTLDKDHTYPSFEFSHMGISVWRGKFTKTSGKLTLDRAAHTGSINVVVNTDSISFGNAKMDTAAVTADWFNVEWHPTMNFQGSLRFEGDVPVAVEGTLNMLGTTRPLILKINQFKCIPHPIFRREVCGAVAEGELNRADYGMKLYSDGEAGKVRLHITAEALKD
jgi:polyisoprenoid-binding protein YceI